jgi:hypothetical protein
VTSFARRLARPPNASTGSDAISIANKVSGATVSVTSSREATSARQSRERTFHAAWEDFGAGWDAAKAAGLMQDPLHPTQRGHDDTALRVQAVLA